jgi:hypothetical protein
MASAYLVNPKRVMFPHVSRAAEPAGAGPGQLVPATSGHVNTSPFFNLL